MQSDMARKLSILADAAKYDASCASSGGTRRDSSAQQGRHLPQLRARRPLHLAAEDPAHQLVHIRLRLLH
jgi:hypothetical protein